MCTCLTWLLLTKSRLLLFVADMHAKPIVDRSSVWEDGSPDTASRVPNIGDIDMGTVNRVLYQVCTAFMCAVLPYML